MSPKLPRLPPSKYNPDAPSKGGSHRRIVSFFRNTEEHLPSLVQTVFELGTSVDKHLVQPSETIYPSSSVQAVILGVP